MQNQKFHGFTLIEVLVAVSIIAILGTLITQTFLTTVRTNKKIELMKDIKQNGDYALSIMNRMIQNAQSISSCGANALSLVNPDNNITTFSVATDGGVCRIASGSAYLTSRSVSVGDAASCGDNITFACAQVFGVDARVSVNFVLQQTGSSPQKIDISSSTFSTSVQLRNVSP